VSGSRVFVQGNIRNAKAMAVEGFSVYEAVKFENLIIEKAALEQLLNRLV
jgi:large subunit ribosomal protein L4